MKNLLALLSTAALYANGAILKETFTDASFAQWVPSTWKAQSEIGKWEVSSGLWPADEEASRGMRTTEDAKFYAISKKLDKAFSNEGKTLVVQYAVKNEKKESSFCGGGYVKLLPSNTNQANFGVSCCCCWCSNA